MYAPWFYQDPQRTAPTTLKKDDLGPFNTCWMVQRGLPGWTFEFRCQNPKIFLLDPLVPNKLHFCSILVHNWRTTLDRKFTICYREASMGITCYVPNTMS